MFSNVFASSQQDSEANESYNIPYLASLSWETRLKGFVICAVISLFTSLTGSFFLLTGGTDVFGVMYTLGTVCSILSTVFLMGPMRQIKGMFDEKRRIATLVLFGSIIFTIMAACVLDIPILALLSCGVQLVAYIWYTLSYIPYARDAVKGCLGTCFSC